MSFNPVPFIAEFIVSVLVDTENPEALESFFELVIILLFAYILGNVQGIWMYVKRWYSPYVGTFVFIINNGQSRTYLLLTIKPKRGRSGFHLRGVQYSAQGKRSVDFESDNVTFRTGGLTEYIEFIWRAEVISSKQAVNGYVQMRPDYHHKKRQQLYGRGFFVTFEQNPQHLDIRFTKLTDETLSLLELAYSKTEVGRREFVVLLHHKLESNPDKYQYLLPLEESENLFRPG